MKIFFFTAVLFLAGCSDHKKDPYSHLPENQRKMIRAKQLGNRALDNSTNDTLAIIADLDSAIALRPTYTYAYRNKAIFLWKLKDYDELLKVNTILRTLTPMDDWLWDFHRAIVLEASGDVQNAKLYYDSGLNRYRKFYSKVLPQIELPYLVDYIDFLSFCGLQKESDEKLKELKEKYGWADPSWMNYKAKTKKEWINWNLHYDGTDYSGPEWSDRNR